MNDSMQMHFKWDNCHQQGHLRTTQPYSMASVKASSSDLAEPTILKSDFLFSTSSCSFAFIVLGSEALEDPELWRGTLANSWFSLSQLEGLSSG